MNITRIIYLLLLSAATFWGCCHSPQKSADNSRNVTVAELAKDPEKFLDKSFVVTGTLKNAGENYFRDMRLVLLDDKGNSISVRPWLPLEVPPPRPGPAKRERPKVMSGFLNRALEIKGVWQKENDIYYLMVNEAMPVETTEKQK
jgi:hypothetical protein